MENGIISCRDSVCGHSVADESALHNDVRDTRCLRDESFGDTAYRARPQIGILLNEQGRTGFAKNRDSICAVAGNLRNPRVLRKRRRGDPGVNRRRLATLCSHLLTDNRFGLFAALKRIRNHEFSAILRENLHTVIVVRQSAFLIDAVTRVIVKGDTCNRTTPPQRHDIAQGLLW